MRGHRAVAVKKATSPGQLDSREQNPAGGLGGAVSPPAGSGAAPRENLDFMLFCRQNLYILPYINHYNSHANTKRSEVCPQEFYVEYLKVLLKFGKENLEGLLFKLNI